VQVIVAALRNARLDLPDDPRQLHELDLPPSSLSAEPAIASRQLEHTDDFRWGPGRNPNPKTPKTVKT
jgi:hypothetical protein